MKNNLKFLVFSLFCKSGFLIASDNDQAYETNIVEEEENQSGNDIILNQTEKKIYNRIIDVYKVLINIVLEDVDPSRPLIKTDTTELVLYLKNNYQLVQAIMQPINDERSLSRIQLKKEFNFIINLLSLYEKIIKNKTSENPVLIDFNEKNNLKLFQAIHNRIEQYAYLLEENQAIEADSIKLLLQNTGNVIMMLLTLYTDINGYLKSGMGYFKIGFIKEQIFDKKKIILDNPNHYQRQYQNGILIDLVLEKVQELQQVFQLITEIPKENNISRKNFFLIYNQFIYNTMISSISFLKFLIKTNFQFWGNENEIKNIAKIKKYIEYQVEIIEKEIKQKNKKKYFNQFDELNFSEKISQLEKIVRDAVDTIIELNKEEEQCRLYWSQKIYKKIYNELSNVSQNGYLAQGMQTIKNNFSNIFAMLIGLDAGYFIKNRRSVICGQLAVIAKDIWDMVNNATRSAESPKDSAALRSLYELFVVRANQLLDDNKFSPSGRYLPFDDERGDVFPKNKVIIFRDGNVWDQGIIKKFFDGENHVPWDELFANDKDAGAHNANKLRLSNLSELELFNMLLKFAYNEQQAPFNQGNVAMIRLHKELCEKNPSSAY